MTKAQKIGGTRIEAEELNCLSDVKVTKTNQYPLDEDAQEILEPLVKRALQVAADNVSKWISDAVSVNSSGITISYHLVFSESDPDSEDQLFKYVTEEEFEVLREQVDRAVAEGAV